MMTDGYMTTAEIAERFRRPEATVRWWRYIGYGPESVKVGRAALYPVEAVEAFEAQLRAEAAEKAASRAASDDLATYIERRTRGGRAGGDAA
jgi:hypothetical protein